MINQESISKRIQYLLFLFSLLAVFKLDAVIITVNVNTDSASATGGSFTDTANCDLRGAINYLNIQGPGTHTIGFNLPSGMNTITLATALPPFNFPLLTPPNGLSTASVTLDGSNATPGADQQVIITGLAANVRPFYAYQGAVLLQNMTVRGKANGGDGGLGAGGGGAGLGGALFVDAANVTINNVVFANCNVTGGNGGAVNGANGGGGGGMAGNGGNGSDISSGGGGGGGGLHPGASGGNGGMNNGNSGGGGGGGGSFGAGGAGGNGTASGVGGAGGGGGYGGTNATGAAGNAGGAGFNGGSGGSINGYGLGGGGGGGTSGGNGGTGGYDGAVCDSGTTVSGGGGGCTSAICTVSCLSGSSSGGGHGGAGGGGGGAGSGVTLLAGATGGLGGGGGGAGGTDNGSHTAGFGGYLGGGGGGNPNSTNASAAGNGGFGGGGGGGALSSATLYGSSPASGGFGAGGGGCHSIAGLVQITPGGSRFGGGDGGLNGNATARTLFSFHGVGGGTVGSTATAATSGGGGGAAFGSAVFVNTPAGGSITFQSNSSTPGAGSLFTSTSGSTAAGGLGSGSGNNSFMGPTSGAGVQEIFMETGHIVFNAVNPSDILTISAAIADDTLQSVPASTTYQGGKGTGISVIVNSGGAGTVIFQGTSTYGGTGATTSTTVAGGTLRISSDSSLGAAAVPLILSGASTTLQLAGTATSTRSLTINAGVAATFDTAGFDLSHTGTFSIGSGSSLTKIGTGTFTLNDSITTAGVPVTVGNGTSAGGTLALGGTNTYSGATTINTGSTLQATGTNNFSANSAHTLNGSGTLTNSSTQTIGSLAGGSSSSTVALGTGTLTTNGNGTSTSYAGALTGTTGALTVAGGSLTLASTSTGTYTGNTTVNPSATLIVNGTLASPTIVNGLLKGTGTINNTVTVNSGASILAGNSIGTFNLGSLVLNSGSTMLVELAQGNNNSSVYNVTDGVTLAGTLSFTVDGTLTGTNTYNFIIAGGSITGAFSTINWPAGFTTQINYGEHGVQFALYKNESLGAGMTFTGSQATMVSYLNPLSSIPDLQFLFIDLGGMDTAQLGAALNSISPTRNATASTSSTQSTFGTGGTATTHVSTQRVTGLASSSSRPVAAIYEEKNKTLLAANENITASQSDPLAWKWGRPDRNIYYLEETQPNLSEQKGNNNDFWASGFGVFLFQEGQNNNPNTNSKSYGALIGYDRYFDNGLFSISGGYVRNQIVQQNHAGSGHSNGATIGLYGSKHSAADGSGFDYLAYKYIEFGILSGYNRFEMKRNIVIGGLNPFNATAVSHFNVWQLMPHIGLGYDRIFGANKENILEPFASLDAAAVFQENIRESGAFPLNMVTQKNTSITFRTQIGLNYYKNWNNEYKIGTLQISSGYVNQASLHTNSTSALVIALEAPSGGGWFVAPTFNKILHLGFVGANLFVKHKPSNVFMSVSYEGEFGSGFMTNNVQGMIGLLF